MKKVKLRLGLWGGAGSGKTTYLSMLLQYLRSNSSSNWSVAIEPSFRERFNFYINGILEGRVFPVATAPAEKAQLGRLILTPKRKRRFSRALDNVEVELSFIDVAGELYERFREADFTIVDGGTGDLMYRNLIDYLIDCHGILFFLDPERDKNSMKDSYRSILTSLFEICRERLSEREKETAKLLPQYIAFCVTKIDIEELWQTREPMDAAKEIMGDDLFCTLQNYIYFNPNRMRDNQKNRCRFFGISSIGRYFDPSTNEYKEAIVSPDDPLMESEKSIQHNKEENLEEEEYPFESTEGAWAIPSTMSVTTPKKAYVSQARITQGVKLEPSGISDPIDWLIRSVRSNPPF